MIDDVYLIKSGMAKFADGSGYAPGAGAVAAGANKATSAISGGIKAYASIPKWLFIGGALLGSAGGATLYLLNSSHFIQQQKQRKLRRELAYLEHETE